MAAATSWAVPLFSAMAGASVGGVATLGGSVVVNRLELRRRERVALYSDTVPALRLAILRTWSPGDDYNYKGPSVVRAARIAGWSEQRLASAVARVAEQRWALNRESQRQFAANGEPLPDGEKRAIALKNEALTTLDQLSHHLERKTRPASVLRSAGTGPADLVSEYVGLAFVVEPDGDEVEVRASLRTDGNEWGGYVIGPADWIAIAASTEPFFELRLPDGRSGA